MITKLWELLSRSLYVGNWDYSSYQVSESPETNYQQRADELKNVMGPLYICHSSNRVKRVDGKVYGSQKPRAKLRKV